MLIEVQEWRLNTPPNPNIEITLGGVPISAREIDVQFGLGTPAAEIAKTLVKSRPLTATFTSQLDPEDSEALFDALDELARKKR